MLWCSKPAKGAELNEISFRASSRGVWARFQVGGPSIKASPIYLKPSAAEDQSLAALEDRHIPSGSVAALDGQSQDMPSEYLQ